jgi:hypothetical protein
VAVGATLAAAQQTATVPQVLQIEREFLKPGKGGLLHDRSESAFVATNAKARVPYYYLAVNSMSGKSRALYLASFDSFADWEKSNKLTEAPGLMAELDHEAQVDGELLTEVDSGVFTYVADLSYHVHTDIAEGRYLEISTFHVKPGRSKDWHKIAAMVKAGHDKAGTSAHWAMYEAAYGADDGTYLALTTDRSMADIDTGFAEGKKFEAALGEEGMKKLDDLFAATVDWSRSELFSFNPKQSYADPEWIKIDPDYWKPKTGAASAAKPAAAPGAKPSAATKATP